MTIYSDRHRPRQTRMGFFRRCAFLKGVLKRAPVLLSGDIIARANETEHIGELSSLCNFSIVLSFHCSKLIVKKVREVFFGGLFALLLGFKQASYLF